MNIDQQIVREREANLVNELVESMTTATEHVENWFQKRWGVPYKEVINKKEGTTPC